MKKINPNKWVVMPERNSKEWRILMGMVMANIKYAFANLQVVDPEFSTFDRRERDILRYMRDAGVSLPVSIHTKYSYKPANFGIGVFLKGLQPYMKPFLKISKEKIGREFRAFLLDCIHKHRERLRNNGRGNEIYTITFKDYSNYIPNMRYPYSHLRRFRKHNPFEQLHKCYIILARNREGKTVKGFIKNIYGGRVGIQRNGITYINLEAQPILSNDQRVQDYYYRNAITIAVDDPEIVTPVCMLPENREGYVKK